MDSLPAIRTCSEQNPVGKTFHWDLSFKTIPFPEPKEPGKYLSFEWLSNWKDRFNIPLNDSVISSHLSQAELSGVCKSQQGSGYYFSDVTLKNLRTRFGYKMDGAHYGMFNSFLDLIVPTARDISYGFIGTAHSLLARMRPKVVSDSFPYAGPWEGMGFTFAKGLRMSTISSLLIATPVEIYQNYHAVKAGDRTVGEAIADGVTDIGIGTLSGAVGITTGMRIGMAVGSAINPGLGTVVGLFAGSLIGFGAGYLMDLVKHQAMT